MHCRNDNNLYDTSLTSHPVHMQKRDNYPALYMQKRPLNEKEEHWFHPAIKFGDQRGLHPPS